MPTIITYTIVSIHENIRHQSLNAHIECLRVYTATTLSCRCSVAAVQTGRAHFRSQVSLILNQCDCVDCRGNKIIDFILRNGARTMANFKLPIIKI